ncbi:hypothetical protein MKW94_027214 [Papaver nudicaule]|uniref:Uncharacterized protein n=1 Tax=Papaver nudicaule TaxID=74823 RepID=A0AA41VYV8_PAPNU|nr:hypothetical protein [Papaver nudicaule]
MATKISLLVLFLCAIVGLSSQMTLAESNTVDIKSLSGSEMCRAGEHYEIFLCGPTTVCTCCSNNCKIRCERIGSTVESEKCTKFTNAAGSPTTRCQCCCKKLTPPPSRLATPAVTIPLPPLLKKDQ